MPLGEGEKGDKRGLELDSRGNRLSLQSSEGYKERMDRSPEGAHDDEVTWLMYAAIGIADGIHIIRGIFGRQGENFIFHYFWSSQPSFVNIQFLLTNSLYKAREKKKNTDPKAK